ncbi:MAG: hypothetical protein HDT33_10965 [Clostridiales bacterium]|nr:hypothetical protein [Clostridiales bacterium]
MNRNAAKGIFLFLLFMLFFTFVSHHLDVLRTPQVLCVTPGAGVVNGTSYRLVVPSEAVYPGAEPYVYVVEDTLSWFYPVAARQSPVRVLDSGDGKTAVDGLYREAQVVWFADRALTGGPVPVRVSGEEAP